MLEKEKLQIVQRTRELKSITELAKNEARDKIYSPAIGYVSFDLQSDYEKNILFQMNLPTIAATKQSFANPEVCKVKGGLYLKDALGSYSVKDEDRSSSYVASEFLPIMYNIRHQQ